MWFVKIKCTRQKIEENPTVGIKLKNIYIFLKMCLFVSFIHIFFPFVFSFLRNLESRGMARRRAIPSISKSREEEIRKILRSNLQKTRQRVSDTGEACLLSSFRAFHNQWFCPLLALSFAPTAGTTWWSTRLRTMWVRFASGGSGWRWRGGWVYYFFLFYQDKKLICS